MGQMWAHRPSHIVSALSYFLLHLSCPAPSSIRPGGLCGLETQSGNLAKWGDPFSAAPTEGWMVSVCYCL